MTQVQSEGSAWCVLSRAYDNNFRLIFQSINGSTTINYTYDNDGLLTGAGDLTIQRDSTNGLITGTTLGSIMDTISYQDTLQSVNYGEVATYTAQYNTNPLYAVAYERDHLGRITRKTETINGETHVFQYTYYTRGWLHEVIEDGVTISTYTYDENGNRLSHTTPTDTITATYDHQDRLVTYGDSSYTYTDNGELLTKTDANGTTTYTYDELGNLINVTLPDGTVINYIIDAANRRIGKKVNGSITQKFLYDSQLHPIAELDASDNIVSIFGPGFMINYGVSCRFITDHLGSIRVVVNKDTGEIVQRMEYDEFGNIITDTNPGFQPFGFAGGLYDADTGLVRFGARDYDPNVGRWTAKDPILFFSGNRNLYGYVLNNPINFTDPSGLIKVMTQNPVYKSRLEDAIKKLREQVMKNNCDKCRQYFLNSPNNAMQDIDQWLFNDNGPPYIMVRDRKRTDPKDAMAFSQNSEPFWNITFFTDYLNSPKNAIGCGIPSIILHEAGHLAQKDTRDTDSERDDFFKDCSFGCIKTRYK